ncbi:MAG: ABC transporter substrate-binding protein, partial [Athalassotoga sp.]|nr:ABC transporter substrate-binding protein [Mesoaciditoga lauensis]
MKKSLIFVSIALIGILAVAFGQSVVNPNTFVYEEPGPFVSLDPAWCYDTVSDEILMQVYENLIQYDGTSTVNFLPMLSTNVPSVADGTILDNGTTYVFHI